jgi:hypothetical protein
VELGEHDSDPVPRHRIFRRGAQHHAVRVERLLESLTPAGEQREIQARLHELRTMRERGPEDLERLLG